jgi:hypothetical protein
MRTVTLGQGAGVAGVFSLGWSKRAFQKPFPDFWNTLGESRYREWSSREDGAAIRSIPVVRRLTRADYDMLCVMNTALPVAEESRSCIKQPEPLFEAIQAAFQQACTGVTMLLLLQPSPLPWSRRSS